MPFTASVQPRCTLQPATTTTTVRRRRHAHPKPKLVGAAAAGNSTTQTTTACRAVAAAASSSASVAEMWRQVHGSRDWDGLLEPLHPVLRDEVARYGGLVCACYDALDMDPSSARYMSSKHRKERVLRDAGAGAAGVGMAGAGYEVTRYIYAAPDVAAVTPPATGAWVGYVAVSTDEMTRRLGRRDVLVSFRGTVTPAEWTANLMSSLRPARLDARDPRPDVKVESGFLNLYTSSAAADGKGSCRDQLLREVSRVIASCCSSGAGGGDEDVSITLVGHSMGGALALLLGYDLSQLGLNRHVGASGSSRVVPIAVFSFGSPRVGNAAFKACCDALGVKVLRVANVRDPVTHVPGAFVNERTRGLLGALVGGSCYMHVGEKLSLDFASLRDIGSAHDLGAYVRCLVAQENRGRPSSRDGVSAPPRIGGRGTGQGHGGGSAAATDRDGGMVLGFSTEL